MNFFHCMNFQFFQYCTKKDKLKIFCTISKDTTNLTLIFLFSIFYPLYDGGHDNLEKMME